MSRRYQSVRRPDGPLTPDVLIGLLAELGEAPPARTPRPYTKTARPRRPRRS